METLTLTLNVTGLTDTQVASLTAAPCAQTEAYHAGGVDGLTDQSYPDVPIVSVDRG